MFFTHRPVVCLLSFVLTLPGAALPAQAQQIPEPERRYSRFSEPDNKPEELEVNMETAIHTRITVPGVTFVPCQAQVALAYSQRNTVARVEVNVTNKQCPAASGSFEIVASVRADSGELSRLAFPENFALDASGELTFTRDYPIGDNVTLSSVRSRRVECACRQTAQEEAQRDE